ncbi:MAG: hypothetical protein HWE21_07575 [Cytophagia bacterium]|nr:hypothetical protein [Cytophagia bacterium]
MTKSVAVFLALSSVIYLEPFFGIAQFGPYFFAFASILASVEPSNSLYLKPHQKYFFIATAVVIVLVTVSEVLGFSEMIPKYIFGFLYCLVGGIIYLKNPKKLRSRTPVLVVWLGEAIKWLAGLLALL